MTYLRSIPVVAGLALLAIPFAPTIAASKQKVAADPTAGIGITGSGTYSTQPDPKRPGKLLWKIWAKDFSFSSPGKQFTGTLIGISAVLFQAGKPAATMTAPKAQGDSTKRVIIATGGVKLKSLAEPGTTLQSDQMYFDANTSTVTAQGHVIYHNGKTGTTIVTPQLVADTVLKTIRSSAGGHVTIPKGL